MSTTTGYAVIYRATEDSDEAAQHLDAAEREDVALADVMRSASPATPTQTAARTGTSSDGSTRRNYRYA